MAMGLNGAGRGRGRRRRGNRRAPVAEINVTPLVDVMLVLLIIFMVTAPLLTAGVPVDLPESRASALPQESEQVTVSMLSDGSVYIDDAPVTGGSVGDALAAIAPATGGQAPEVVLRADRGLDYGRVMAVMGELSRAGFTSISLVTDGSDRQP